MVEIVVNYEQLVNDEESGNGWFESKKDYLYFRLSVGDILKMWKNADLAAKWAKQMEQAMAEKNAKRLYCTLKDVVVCAYIGGYSERVRSFEEKEMWKNLLFSKSKRFYRLMDILIDKPAIANPILEQMMIDDGTIHTYELTVPASVFSSERFEKEMKI